MAVSRSLLSLVVIVGLLGLVNLSFAQEENAVLRSFAQWLGENKVQSNVNLGVFQNYRIGGVAGKAVANEEFLIRAPKSLIITADVAQSHGPFPTFTEWGYNTEPFVAFLLHHLSQPSSSWKPYIDVLPTNFASNPLTWVDSDLEELQASPIRGQITTLRNQLVAAHQRLLTTAPKINEVFPDGSLTFERYLWAFLVTSSRMFTTANGPIIVPLVDMLNHDPSAAVGDISADGEFFVVNSTRDYQKGEQVFVSYGPKSNGELLKTYGFVLEDNAADFLTLHFELKLTNLVESIVEPVLRKQDPQYAEVAIAKNRRPDRLLRTYRLSLLEFKELEHLSEAMEGKPISLSNELKSYRGIISGLQSLLQTYPTTEAEDAELLKDATLSVNKRNAVVLRKAEKEIIQNNILVMAKLWENILLEGAMPLGVPLR